MMGYEFATAVNTYMNDRGLEVGNIGKIDSNPDRSKHLETATTKVFGQAVDFVNLRTETYQDDSRIPSMVIKFLVNYIAFLYIILIFSSGFWDSRRRRSPKRYYY